MFGQLISGIKGDNWEGSTTTINHLWTNTCLQHLILKSDITEWFTAILEFELSVGFYIISPSGAVNKAAFFRNYKANLTCVEGIMHWEFKCHLLSSLKIESGLIPYTTNPQVKTLGNYLFRSSIHPPSIQNKIDYPWADLSGGIAEVGLFDNKVTVEAMIASEFIYVPWFDFTPAFGLNYKPNEIIDAGGTIAFNHAIPVHSGSLPDTISHNKWQGTKLDFRAIFDPKPLLGGMDFL